MNRGKTMFNFKDEKDMKIEDLTAEVKSLQIELAKQRERRRVSTQINKFMDKSAIRDDLFKVLFQYLKELIQVVGTPTPDIDLKVMKEYFEDLFDGEVRIEFFVGENLYKKSFVGSSVEDGVEGGLSGKSDEFLVGDVAELYNLSTTNTLDIQKILTTTEAKEGLTELSRVKYNRTGLGHYQGVAIWVMQKHLEQFPGFVIFMLEKEKYLTPIQKEIIQMFMTMIQPIINNKISLGRLSEVAKNAERVAYTDGLTGIPNRTKFNDDYMYNDTKNLCTVVYIDLCRLKRINDEHGHHIADGVIVEFAKQIKKYANTYGGKAYRVGGDEFVAVFPHTTRNSELVEATEAFQRKYHQTTFKNDQGVEFKTHASIGVQENRDGEMTREEVLRRADALMYLSKQDRENYPIKYSWKEDLTQYENDDDYGYKIH